MNVIGIHSTLCFQWEICIHRITVFANYLVLLPSHCMRCSRVICFAPGYTCMLTSVLKNTSWAGTLKVVHFVVCMLYSIRGKKKKYDSRLRVCQSSCWSWTASVSSDHAAVLLSSNPCSWGDFRVQESSHLALSKNSMLWGCTGQPRTFRQDGETCKTGAVEASIRICWDNTERSKVKPMLGLGWRRRTGTCGIQATGHPSAVAQRSAECH